jgi:hypothetical protein
MLHCRCSSLAACTWWAGCSSYSSMSPNNQFFGRRKASGNWKSSGPTRCTHKMAFKSPHTLVRLRTESPSAADAVGLAFLRCGGALAHVAHRRMKIERVYRPYLTATEAESPLVYNEMVLCRSSQNEDRACVSPLLDCYGG